MDALVWVENKLDNTDSQALLEEKAKVLLEGPLKDKSEYQQEKALKSFSEKIMYLESLLMYQKGIHHKQLDFTRISQDYREKHEDVAKAVRAEINRETRHYLIFLT